MSGGGEFPIGPGSGPGLGGSLGSGGWMKIFESFTGAWQQNVVADRTTLLSYFAVYACITLIAADIAKLRVKFVEQDDDDIWEETTNPAYSPVLRKPNRFQTRIQFWESWMLSKLSRGNTYALKVRDNRNVVIGLYVLNPDRTLPLLAPDGSVFYQLSGDYLNGIPYGEIVIVPAREIIHDRMNCLYHPLVGTSPLWAAAYAAMQGIAIQSGSAKFFQNASQPGGILTAPAAISDATALRIKNTWETNFQGANAGRVAVLGDGLKYERMALTATESQLIDQLKWTGDVVCSVFHVPPYKIGLGDMPNYRNIQALNIEYYAQCLQSLIEAAEICLDEGLECAPGQGTEFDVDNLLRMDSTTLMATLAAGVGGAILSPNEARRRLDLPPVKGGESPIAQQQNYTLAALAARETAPAGTLPLDPPTVPPPPDDEPDDPNVDEADEPDDKALVAAFSTNLRELLNA